MNVTARGGGPAPASLWADPTCGRNLVVTLRAADQALAVLRSLADGRIVVAGAATPSREENGSMAAMFNRCDDTMSARVGEVLIG